jgi:hypothetical protein
MHLGIETRQLGGLALEYENGSNPGEPISGAVISGGRDRQRARPNAGPRSRCLSEVEQRSPRRAPGHRGPRG